MIILENLDFQWQQQDISEVVDMWNENINIKYIAKAVKRSTDETFLLLFHLAREGKIKKRKNGILGVE